MWRLSPGLLTCNWDGGHGEWVRCRTCELCRPRPRWMLQHSSQINTPLLTEAQRGSGTGCKCYSTSQRDCKIADDGAQKTYNHHRWKPIRSEGADAISNTQPILNSRFLCLIHIRKPISWMRRGVCLTRNDSYKPVIRELMYFSRLANHLRTCANRTLTFDWNHHRRVSESDKLIW